MEINYKIVKEQFKLPTNIPISKACSNLLKGMLEKNPQLRIELNNPLVDEWLNDNTKLMYKRKKPNIMDKSIIKEIEIEEIIEEEKNSSHQQGKDNDTEGELINNYFKPNSKNNTSNLDLLTTADLDEDVLREPAKFDSEEETNSSNKFNSRPSLNSNSLKSKIEQLNINVRPAKKNTTISSKGNLTLSSSNGLSGVKVKNSPKKSSSKLDNKESPVKKSFK
jgi:hypothetical protein